MKVGRNDPCPCGSGKKYKKCCLLQDQRQAITARKAQQATVTTTKPTITSSERLAGSPDHTTAVEAANVPVSAIDRCWDQFEASDYEERIRLFLQTLDEPYVMDDEMAFDMLTDLSSASIKRNERARFEALLDALQSRLPSIYEESAHEYLAWRIDNALALARHDAILPLAKALAERADRDFDNFASVRDQLAYHGQYAALLEAMRTAHPKICGNDDITDWGQKESTSKARKYVIFDYVERTAVPDPDDPILLQELQSYGPIDPEKLAKFISHFTGQLKGQWTLQDFETDAPERRSVGIDDDLDETAETTATQTFCSLGLEFIGYLHRVEGVSYTKADLGASELCHYLVERDRGALHRLATPAHSARGRQTKSKPPPKVLHPLCPDYTSLRHYLTREAGFLLHRQHALAAALELVPLWLRFLQAQSLIDEARQSTTIAALRPLCRERLDLCEESLDDPAPSRNLKLAYGLALQ